MKKLALFACLLGSLNGIGQALSNIESVEYDAANDRHLISNGSSIISRASDGTLSYFGTEAKAKYGMEIMNGTLFCIHNTNIMAYDLETGEEVMVFNIPGMFLNGMASDGVDRLWVTDFSAKKVYEIDVADLDNPSYAEVIIDLPETPNGIVYDEFEDRLLMVHWGSNPPIRSIDPSDYSYTTEIISAPGNCDGIDDDGEGNFYVSSWAPYQIRKYNSDFTTVETISAPGINAPADICYSKETDVLAIPNVGSSTLVLIDLSNATNVEEMAINNQISVYPNPVSDQSYISFELNESAKVQIQIFDNQGRLVHHLFEGNLPAGQQKILLAGIPLSAGQYHFTTTIENQRHTGSFIYQP